MTVFIYHFTDFALFDKFGKILKSDNWKKTVLKDLGFNEFRFSKEREAETALPAGREDKVEKAGVSLVRGHFQGTSEALLRVILG